MKKKSSIIVGILIVIFYITNLILISNVKRDVISSIPNDYYATDITFNYTKDKNEKGNVVMSFALNSHTHNRKYDCLNVIFRCYTSNPKVTFYLESRDNAKEQECHTSNGSLQIHSQYDVPEGYKNITYCEFVTAEGWNW